MTTRNQRRLMKKIRTVKTGVTDAQVSMHLISRMAEDGEHILSSLRGALSAHGINGGETSGHVVDALMHAAARMEESIVRGEPENIVGDMVMVLFLARHLAIREGKIVTAPVASA